MVLGIKAQALAAKIQSKEAVIAVIGMGYVGLSLFWKSLEKKAIRLSDWTMIMTK